MRKASLPCYSDRSRLPRPWLPFAGLPAPHAPSPSSPTRMPITLGEYASLSPGRIPAAAAAAKLRPGGGLRKAHQRARPSHRVEDEPDILRGAAPRAPVTWRVSHRPHAQPGEGRRPTTPQNDAGMRSEPPRSVPSASDHARGQGHRPAAGGAVRSAPGSMDSGVRPNTSSKVSPRRRTPGTWSCRGLRRRPRAEPAAPPARHNRGCDRLARPATRTWYSLAPRRILDADWEPAEPPDVAARASRSSASGQAVQRALVQLFSPTVLSAPL